MKAIINGDLVVGTGFGNLVGIDIPAELAGVPLAHLRFDGTAIVDVSARTNWHVDELGQRHIAPAAGRVALACALDDEIERDGGGWHVVDRLARLKLRRKADIDAEAERQRLRWITPGAGQAMTYQAKVDEARALAVEAEEADPSHYPMLSAEVGITAATLQHVAGVVLAAYQQWQAIGAAIEAARLGGKRAVDLAETAEDVAAIEITWPNPA